MERSRRVCLWAASLLSSCDSGATVREVSGNGATDDQERVNNQSMGKKMKMKVKIGSKTFAATLDDNAATGRLKAMLPLTLDMSELNGNEKYFHFSTDLPSNDSNPGTIRSGDLMLWQKNSFVLFYETFETSYSYTRLGRLDDPTGLAEAVGKGSVTVTFELE
jgi:hypothetical protein